MEFCLARLQVHHPKDDGPSPATSIRTAGSAYRFLPFLLAMTVILLSCVPQREKPAGPVHLVFEPDGRGRSDFGQRPSSPEPILANPDEILAWPAESWRNPRFEVFRWRRFPSILIFDTADYRMQDGLFKRLAFFAEKRGFRGRLAGNQEIADLHGWNAHDYGSGDLAAFFARAGAEGFPLGAEELELRNILLEGGIVAEAGGSLVGSGGAVLSISRESNAALRSLLMTHEGFHGLFAIDGDFRRFAAERWNGLPADAQQMMLTFLDDAEYDIGVDYIVLKEFASFVLQQPTERAGQYFSVTMPSRITNRAWWDANRHLRDASGSFARFGEVFRGEAEAFGAYVGERWGLAAGRVW